MKDFFVKDMDFFRVEGAGHPYWRIWADDVRLAPKGFYWVRSTREALSLIGNLWEDSVIRNVPCKIYLDLDHDAGDYAADGGDYINILDAIEEHNFKGDTDIQPVVHIHSMNPVGVENMRRIIQKNNWEEAR